MAYNTDHYSESDLVSSVETQQAYILFTNDIVELEEDLFPLQEQLEVDVKRRNYLRDFRVGWAQERINAWSAAGNSDTANKAAKLAHYREELRLAEEELAELNESIPELQADVKKLQDQIDEISGWRAAFVREYKSNLSKGMHPEDAADKAAAESEFQTYKAIFERNKTLLWTVGGLVAMAIAITIFIVAYKRK